MMAITPSVNASSLAVVISYTVPGNFYYFSFRFSCLSPLARLQLILLEVTVGRSPRTPGVRRPSPCNRCPATSTPASPKRNRSGETVDQGDRVSPAVILVIELDPAGVFLADRCVGHIHLLSALLLRTIRARTRFQTPGLTGTSHPHHLPHPRRASRTGPDRPRGRRLHQSLMLRRWRLPRCGTRSPPPPSRPPSS